ncbi:hypothetical protein [Streptomyces sp. URMC 123]|uniref:hypothetical protein n=1 Tax=Streptomyces sp. URMC 123 TaxID=3423403 RepID=UPI003F1E37F3
MNDVPTDEEVLETLRPLREMERERAEMAAVVDRFRLTEDPRELAERNRCGERMAELDREIIRLSIPALDRIGLWNAAILLRAAAIDEGIIPDDTP